MLKDWKGDIVFSDSVAIFRGHVADNKMHSHWASQLTVALDGILKYDLGAGVLSARAVYLPSKTKHRLLSGFVCSIYFDPLANTILNNLIKGDNSQSRALSAEDMGEELASISSATDLSALLSSIILNPKSNQTREEDRLKKVLGVIKTHLNDEALLDRGSLAKLVHLSPSRFSHWFVEQTGVPLRSYKKWLKLRMAMDALLDGQGPMEAAMLAGFSDLPHMSREFSESFGLTYLDAQKAWQRSNKK